MLVSDNEVRAQRYICSPAGVPHLHLYVFLVYYLLPIPSAFFFRSLNTKTQRSKIFVYLLSKRWRYFK